jgi:hypothetical protein
MMLLRLLIALVELILAAPEAILRTAAGLLAILRVRLHRSYDYRRWLARDLADCDTILELGCGRNSPVLQVGLGKRTVAFDIWQPYVTMHQQRGSYLACVCKDILAMGYPEKAYDAVVICDVLEHLRREEVVRRDLFALMEKAARKKVIIFTPNGFMENDCVDDDPYQAHVSAWEPADYTSRGYSVKGATGIRWILGKASLPKWHPYSLWAIVAMASQPYIFSHPKWAWHSYAVKETD